MICDSLGLTSSKFNKNGVPSGTHFTSSNNGKDYEIQDAGGLYLPFYKDLHIMIPLVISLFAIVAAAASYVFFWKKSKFNFCNKELVFFVVRKLVS